MIAFARGADGEIKGSGRSIVGLHLRDALDLVTKRYPGLVLRFGGHAAAAGLSLREADFELFRRAFEETVRSLLTAADLARQLDTDGSLASQDATYAFASTIADGVWGQGFPEPCFFDTFEVAGQKIVGEAHTRLKLVRNGKAFEAMLFGENATLPARIEAAYRLEVHAYGGLQSLQLTLTHWRSL